MKTYTEQHFQLKYSSFIQLLSDIIGMYYLFSLLLVSKYIVTNINIKNNKRNFYMKRGKVSTQDH